MRLAKYLKRTLFSGLTGYLLLLLGLKLCTIQAQQPSSPISAEMRSLLRTDAPIVVLRHVTLFDGSGAPAKHDQTVVVDHGRIAEVEPDAAISLPHGATVLDESGKTLLPGLIGMHEHLFFPKTGGRFILATVLGESAPRLYLAAGITTARTAGSIAPTTDLAIKRFIEEGKQAGPDLDITGPYLDGSGSNFLPNQILTGTEDARETVDYWSKRGVTSFKAYMYIAPENLKAAIEAAHAHGLKVTGHLCSVGFKEAISLGIDNLEHGILTDTDLNPKKKHGVCPDQHETEEAIAAADIHGAAMQSLIKDLVQHHVAITSTLTVFVNAEPDQPSLESLASTKAALTPSAWSTYLVVRKQLEMSPNKRLEKIIDRKEMDFEREFVRQGGLLMAGADPTGAGNVVPGIADEREIELLIEAGFSSSEAVAIFSRNAARYLGRENEIGTIEKGKRADLLLLNGDFEHDPAAIERPEIVFKNGMAWDSAKLRDSVAGLVGDR